MNKSIMIFDCLLTGNENFLCDNPFRGDVILHIFKGKKSTRVRNAPNYVLRIVRYTILLHKQTKLKYILSIISN
jgi:hypothetical protein